MIVQKVQLKEAKVGDKVHIGNAVYKVVEQDEKETRLKLLCNQYKGDL